MNFPADLSLQELQSPGSTELEQNAKEKGKREE